MTVMVFRIMRIHSSAAARILRLVSLPPGCTGLLGHRRKRRPHNNSTSVSNNRGANKSCVRTRYVDTVPSRSLQDISHSCSEGGPILQPLKAMIHTSKPIRSRTFVQRGVAMMSVVARRMREDMLLLYDGDGTAPSIRRMWYAGHKIETGNRVLRACIIVRRSG
jgi:hypothetical protein